MNLDAKTSHNSCTEKTRGLIAFNETSLRYEKGVRAWIFLGPYLLGAFALEMIFNDGSEASEHVVLWLGLVAYFILFPILWRKLLRFILPTNSVQAKSQLLSMFRS